jgi:tRNA A-37 threonylcarbamoyl transferase component Bud32
MSEWYKKHLNIFTNIERKKLSGFSGVNNCGLYGIYIDNIIKYIIKCIPDKKVFDNILSISENKDIEPENILSRFKLENINDVPHIIKIKAWEKVDDNYEILMEFKKGTDIINIIETIDDENYEQKKNIFYDIGKKIAIFHILGWYHSDLRMRNVLYDIDTKILTIIDIDNMEKINADNVDYLEDILSFIRPDLILNDKNLDIYLNFFKGYLTSFNFDTEKKTHIKNKIIEYYTKYINEKINPVKDYGKRRKSKRRKSKRNM